jgi:hypothetical protein
VPPSFDSELYLRLAGERALLNQSKTNGPPWSSPLLEVAAVLVALGFLPEELAQGIVDDYSLALSLRGHGYIPPVFRRLRHQATPPPQALTPTRVVKCEQNVSLSGGTAFVRYVALNEHETDVSITFKESSRRGRIQRPGMLFGGFGQPVTLTDDQGHSEPAHFSGGGSNGRYSGRLTTMQPLSKSTAWIDLGSDRLELRAESNAARVFVESLPDRPHAEQYLWACLSAGRHGPWGMGRGPDAIDVVTETLLDAGALDPDDPVIEQVRSVTRAFSGQRRADSLPEPWASLLTAPVRRHGPSGIVPLGVITPPIDETVVSFEAIILTDGTLETEVTVSPDIDGASRPMMSSVRRSSLRWWAEDDLGNAYLGSIGSWSGSGERGRGAVSYWPTLDPGATELHLIPTGTRERAVVSVDLPRWKKTR